MRSTNIHYHLYDIKYWICEDISRPLVEDFREQLHRGDKHSIHNHQTNELGDFVWNWYLVTFCNHM